jgi:hypothetical protein
VLQLAVRDIGQLTDLCPATHLARAGQTRAVSGASRNDEPAPRDPPGDSALILDGIRALHDRMTELESQMVIAQPPHPDEPPPPGEFVHLGELARLSTGLHFVPAWRRPTQGEVRWPAALAVAAAVGLQIPLPGREVLIHPVWMLPVLEALLLMALVIANPHRINTESRLLRMLGLTVAALLSLANAWSVARLIIGLVQGTAGGTPGPLLVTGGIIWLTNVIVFGLWYWELDRGGPVARAHADRMYPDFQFAQMAAPQLAPPDWEPAFGDYFYLAFTNAAAFSPTDVLPMSRWAKMAMTLQASVSIVTVALVVARAVNILK